MKLNSIKILFLSLFAFSLNPFPSFAGWEQLDNNWKYSNDGQYLQNTWMNENGNWYYFDANARMKTGVHKINGITYAFNSSGAMQTGWVLDNKRWYYFNPDGTAATAWIPGISDTWYYVENGTMISNGWKNINGADYYFYRSGKMAANTYVGKYFIDEQGQIDETRPLTDRSYKTINDLDQESFTAVMENIPDNVRKLFFTNGKLLYDSSEQARKLDLMSESLDIQASCSGNYIYFHTPEDLYFAFAEYIDNISKASQSDQFASWCDDGSLLDLLGIDSEESAIYSTIRHNMFTVLAANILNPNEIFPDRDNYSHIETYVRNTIYTIKK